MDRLLGELVSAFGVSGSEEAVKSIIKEELKEVKCEIKEDAMGNLIVKMGQGGEKIMFCAHMDQIGVIATYIESNGFIRVGTIGDFRNQDIAHNFVRFKNGTVGKIAYNKDDLYIDLGLKDKSEIEGKVREGDVACFTAPSLELGDGNVISPNLDNRVGCYILIRLIKEIKNTNKEVYFVFSSQEELGGRGARAAAYAINPDYCIVIDLEEAGDVIGGESNVKLGEGPVLKVMDKTLIMHHQVKQMLENASKELNSKIQYSVSNGKSDGGTIHKERAGIRTGELSIPCRYLHSISEMINLKDVEDTIQLLKKLVS